VVVNSIFISTCLYFLVLWGGTKRGVSLVTSKIWNYYWSGMLGRSHARIAWKVYCLSQLEGGFNFIDLEDALVALMTKWIVSACESGQSNFKIL
jgi:hypothetical protein